MAHIVYVTNGMSSTLNSSLELSRRLAEAGHRIRYVSHADIGQTVEAHGFPFHRLERDRELRDAATKEGLLGRRRLRRESSRVAELESLLDSIRPDLLIVDYECHVAIVTAATMEVPMVLAIVWFTIFRHTEIPPMEFAMLPPRSLRERISVRLAWVRTFFEGLRLEWRRFLSREGLRLRLRPISYNTKCIEDVRAVARRRGFDLRRAKRTDWLRPVTYPEFPTLCFNLPEMDFPHSPHPSIHYVGPMIARGRVEVGAGTSSGAWQHFLERRSALERRPPLVYCSLGSFWAADEAFLRRVLDVFERRPEWDLVLGLGARLKPEALAPIPDNALVLSWAPQLEVLAEADAAITHGGVTTINECVAFSVPMLVYSTGHVDQNGCAARVEYHGLGIVADKDQDASNDIERNLESVLTDPAIRANVEAMRGRLLEMERSGLAVATVERFLPTP